MPILTELEILPICVLQICRTERGCGWLTPELDEIAVSTSLLEG